MVTNGSPIGLWDNELRKALMQSNQNWRNETNERYIWIKAIPDNSKQVSLDSPIWSLADSVYELLRIQHWFDAILLIDDTVSSDLFSYRLNRRCKLTNHTIVSSVSPSNDEIKDVWQELMIIKLSRDLEQREVSRITIRLLSNAIIRSEQTCIVQLMANPLCVVPQFYLRLAEIQTSQRRVILVHCDRHTSARIIITARDLALLEGHKIWILLDGLIGSVEISSRSLWRDLDLPTGMIALRQRAQHQTDIKTLSSIIQLLGRTALSAYKNSRFRFSTNEMRNGSTPEVSCWHNNTLIRRNFNDMVTKWVSQVTSHSSHSIHSIHKRWAKNVDPRGQEGYDLWSSIFPRGSRRFFKMTQCKKSVFRPTFH